MQGGLSLIFQVQHRLKLLLLIVFSITLASCGGGGGSSVPPPPPPPTNIIKTASYSNTTCAIQAIAAETKGSLTCWGQIPDITNIDATGNAARSYRIQATPEAMSTEANWVDVAVGRDHICGIKSVAGNNSLHCMGWNNVGQLGLALIDNKFTSYTRDKFTPSMILVDDTSSWISLTAALDHTCGIYGAKTLKCWGANRFGVLAQNLPAPQQGDNPNNPRLNVFTEIDKINSVLKSAAAVDGGSWETVSTNDFHTCGIKLDNSLWCWGRNNVKQLGFALTDAIPFKEFVTQVSPPLTVDSNNTLLFDPSTDVWIDVSVGAVQSCAISSARLNVSDKQGKLWCWGNNTFSELGQPPQNPSPATIGLPNLTPIGSASDWVKVIAGRAQTCAINNVGETFCFGFDAPVQFSGFGYQVTAVAGQNSDWQSITLGFNHACGIKSVNSENKLFCWGQQQYSQLGTSFNYNSLIPNLVVADSIPADDPYVWKQLDTGSTHSCAVKNDGTLWCWGRSYSGQLGLGDVLPNATLQQVQTNSVTPFDWVDVKSNFRTTCARKSNNTVWCWGFNQRTQQGNGSRVNSFSPVQTTGAGAAVENDWDGLFIGDFFSCAQRANDNNSVWCWGSNSFGQIAQVPKVPPANTFIATKTSIVHNLAWKTGKVFTGSRAVCAIDTSDELYCWGDNSFNRIDANANAGVVVSAPKLMPIPSDGGIWISAYIGGNPLVPQIGNNISNGPIVQQTAGSFMCALSGQAANATQGALWCWGDNAFAALGATTTGRSTPVTAPVNVSIESNLITQWRQVSVSDNNVCAIKDDGTLWCWGGSNFQGELGTGSTIKAVTPVQEATKSPDWVAVKTGSRHTCGLQSQNGKTDYSLWCWGGTPYERQLGDSRLVDLNPKLIQ